MEINQEKIKTAVAAKAYTCPRCGSGMLVSMFHRVFCCECSHIDHASVMIKNNSRSKVLAISNIRKSGSPNTESFFSVQTNANTLTNLSKELLDTVELTTHSVMESVVFLSKVLSAAAYAARSLECLLDDWNSERDDRPKVGRAAICCNPFPDKEDSGSELPCIVEACDGPIPTIEELADMRKQSPPSKTMAFMTLSFPEGDKKSIVTVENYTGISLRCEFSIKINPLTGKYMVGDFLNVEEVFKHNFYEMYRKGGEGAVIPRGVWQTIDMESFCVAAHGMVPKFLGVMEDPKSININFIVCESLDGGVKALASKRIFGSAEPPKVKEFVYSSLEEAVASMKEKMKQTEEVFKSEFIKKPIICSIEDLDPDTHSFQFMLKAMLAVGEAHAKAMGFDMEKYKQGIIERMKGVTVSAKK